MSCGVHPKFVTKIHYRHEGAVCLHDISNEIQLKESEITNTLEFMDLLERILYFILCGKDFRFQLCSEPS